MVSHQLQVRCRQVKVRRSESNVLPLSHPTNCLCAHYVCKCVWNALQSDAGKNDSAVTVGYARKDEQPTKKLRADPDIQPTESPRLQSANVHDSTKSTDGENLPFFDDLTASDDHELLPPSPLLDGTLTTSNDLPASLPDARDLCQMLDNCTRSKPQQLCAISRTVSPPASPKLQPIVDCSSHRQSMNGVCDVGALKLQYQTAVMSGVDTTNGCHDDGIADELLTDDVIQSNGLAELESQVIVNGGSIVRDCSCSL